MPVLQKCCFCAKLEIGGYIIGGLAVLYGILFTIGSFLIVDESENEDKIHIALLLTVVTAVIFLNASLLLLGTYKRNPKWIAIWLGLDFISILIKLVNSFSKGILVFLLTGAISTYFWLCIYSLYQMFKEEKEQLNNTIPMEHTNSESKPPSYAETSFPITQGADPVPDYSSIP